MSKYNRVLIPVDWTPGIGPLAPAVRRIIDNDDAEITLLHVVESQPWLGRNAHTVRLMSELELLAHRQFRGARISRRIEWGRPADCILNLIRSAGVDVVLLSAEHLTEGGAPVGPVAAEVLAEASCPVLLEWAMTPPVNWARTHPVCCAIEFDGGERTILQEAAWAASRLKVPLKVISALVPGSTNAALLWDPVEREREVARVRGRLEELRDRYAPGADVEVGVGLPVPVFSRAIRFHGAGLLVAGGSRDVLQAAESACPVLWVGPGTLARAGRPEGSPPAEFAARRSA